MRRVKLYTPHPTTLGKVWTKALDAGAVSINNIEIGPSRMADDILSTEFMQSSAIAKAAAINRASAQTGVTATALPADLTLPGVSTLVSPVTLDWMGGLFINGEPFSGIRIYPNDAGPFAMGDAPEDARRMAVMESSSDIVVSVAQGLTDEDLVINDITIRGTVHADDTFSTTLSDASAIAKAAAINDSSAFTGVTATVLPTVVRGHADITAVTLDSTNNLMINGVMFTSIRVQDNDAGSGPQSDDPADSRRSVAVESTADIPVAGGNQRILDGDVVLNGVTIRSTVAFDDTFSTTLAGASAIAKAAAINDSSAFSGVTATVLPTVMAAQADMTAVQLDSQNYIIINDVMITGMMVQDNDAGPGPQSDDPIDAVRRAYIEGDAFDVNGVPGLQPDDLVINNVYIRASVAANDVVSVDGNSASAIAKVSAINDASAFTGVTATVLPSVMTAETHIDLVTLDANNYLTINDVIIRDIQVERDDATGTLRAAINGNTEQTGVTAALDPQGFLQLTADDGRNIIVTAVGQATNIGLSPFPGTVYASGRIALQSTDTIHISGTSFGKIGISETIIGRVRADGQDNVRSLINSYQDQTGVVASMNIDNRLVLTAVDGRNISITVAGLATRLGLRAAAGTTVFGGRLRLTSEQNISLEGAATIKLGDIGGPGHYLFGAVRADGSDNLRSLINARSATTGVTATLDEDHRLVLTAVDGRNIEVTVSGNGTQLGLAAAAGTTVTGGRLRLESDDTIRLSGHAIAKLGDVGGPAQTIMSPLRADGADTLRSLINARSHITGVTAALNDDQNIVLSSIDGRNIQLDCMGEATKLCTDEEVADVSFVAGGKVQLRSDDDFHVVASVEGAAQLGLWNTTLFVASLRADGRDTLRSLINAAQAQTGVTARLDDNERLVLEAIDGRNIFVDASTADAEAATGIIASLHTGRLTLTSEETFTVTWRCRPLEQDRCFRKPTHRQCSSRRWA